MNQIRRCHLGRFARDARLVRGAILGVLVALLPACASPQADEAVSERQSTVPSATVAQQQAYLEDEVLTNDEYEAAFTTFLGT